MKLRKIVFSATCATCNRGVPIALNGYQYSLNANCGECGELFIEASESIETLPGSITFSPNRESLIRALVWKLTLIPNGAGRKCLSCSQTTDAPGELIHLPDCEVAAIMKSRP